METIRGMILWRPHLAAVPFAILVGLLAIWGTLIYRNLLSRMTRQKTLLLIIPRAMVVTLLMLAILDPVWTRTVVIHSTNKVLAVLDVSSSMEVKDIDQQSRLEHAKKALQNLERALPAGMSFKTLEFDTELREPGKTSALHQPAEKRDTDLRTTLASLSKRADLSSYAAIVLLTDGGDEPLDNVEAPGLPLYIVGVGSTLARARDLAITNIKFPSSVEKEATFEIRLDVIARNPASFDTQDISKVPLTLEREESGQWLKEAEQKVDLSKGQIQTVFNAACHTVGLQHFRVTVKELPGELSSLNNSRAMTVDVRKKSLHILFFARELGLDLKMLRSELMRDTGVTFTALFRTIGERFTIQGERTPGDENLESGFPVDASLLKPFDCVIIGSVPPRDWHGNQLAALKTYVENGGAVIFLGDESAFGPHGDTSTMIAPLLPWEAASKGQDMLRGEFAVSIPAQAANHPIVAGLNELLLRAGTPTVESILPVGYLKAGALALITVGIDQRTVPMVAVQQFGKGTVLALASNTFWKWARQAGERQQAYGLFWRQAIRSLAPSLEGGQILSVKWDKEFYKPGENAIAEVRASLSGNASEIKLTSSLTRDHEIRELPVEPLQGQAGIFNIRLTFGPRGLYQFHLASNQGNNVLESYDKPLPVSPLLGEGAKLELDSQALERLAKLGSGLYVDETGVNTLAKNLTTTQLNRTMPSEVSLVSGSPWFALIFLGILIGEWIIRRRLNLF